MQKLLLHVCCAPCSVVVIEELKDKYDLTVFFYNPNIYPEEEYLKRKKYVVRVCEEWEVKMVDMDQTSSPWEGGDRGGIGGSQTANTPLYPPLLGGRIDYGQAGWCEAVKGLENEPEGGKRCPVCFEMRLDKSAQYASKHDFDWLATSLTSGRNKYAEIINPIGLQVAEKYGIKFFEEDWKKKGRPAFASTSAKAMADEKASAGKQESRQEKATRLVNEKGIYRQDYCGCVYSLTDCHPERSRGIPLEK